MSFNSKIIAFKTSGLKNIEKDIEIKFLPKLINKNEIIKTEGKKIKAIYGNNGAGKTAIISSLELYKNICFNSNYLLNESNLKKLNELINKKTKHFKFESIFARCIDDKVKSIYRHTINLQYDEQSQRYILSEKLEVLLDKSITGNYYELYRTENGNLFLCKEMEKDEHSKSLYDTLIKQRLDSSSVVSNILFVYGELKHIYFNNINDNMLLASILNAFLFIFSLNVYLDNNDRHDPSINMTKMLMKLGGINDSKEESINLNYYSISDEDIIKKTDYDDYVKIINKVYKFIKLLKPSLLKIDIDYKDYGDSYRCRKIFVYSDGYSIDYEYESTGIKKMIKLFNHIKNAFDGDIVFIDEIDANISGVLLDKLMDCFNQYGKGQLCYTSHNIYSMNKLKSFINITTIGETGLIVDILKNGNYNPANQFYEGMIKDSPFNIFTFDFLEIFGDDNDE